MSRQRDTLPNRPTATDATGRILRDVVIGAIVVLDMIAVAAIAMLVIGPLEAPDPMLLALIAAGLWAVVTLFGLLMRTQARRRREAELPSSQFILWWDNAAGAWALRAMLGLGAIVIVAVTASQGLLPAAAYLAAILAALIAFFSLGMSGQQSRAAIRRRGTTTLAVIWLMAAAAATATGASLAILAAAGAATALVIGRVRRAASCSETHSSS